MENNLPTKGSYPFEAPKNIDIKKYVEEEAINVKMQITNMESHARLQKWLNEQVKVLHEEFEDNFEQYFESYIKPVYLAWNKKITVPIQ